MIHFAEYNKFTSMSKICIAFKKEHRYFYLKN